MKNLKRSISLLVFLSLFGAAACTPVVPTLTSEQLLSVEQTLTAIAGEAEAQKPTATPTKIAEPSATPEKTAEPTNTKSPEKTSIGPTNFPEGINPLTGLKVEDPELLKRRPVLVKVSNFPVEGRPHAGLSYADIVFEYYIGAGSNRFIGLYYGQDCGQIGPVRSLRRVDPELTHMYNGVLAGSGGNPENVLPIVGSILQNRYVADKYICPGICDDGHGWVTTVFADSAALTNYFRNRGVDDGPLTLEGMLFDTAVPEGGQDGSKASVNYTDWTRSDWVYDEKSGKYLRWTEDPNQGYIMIPLVDRLTNEQLAFSNVIVLNAGYTEYTTVLHDIYMWKNDNGTKATLFRDGKAYEIFWNVPDQGQPIRFYDADGNPFPLKPGNTWMAIIGNTSDVTKENGEWLFQFRIP